jgi:hypothetical protein
MSALQKLLAGWRFRTRTPSFTNGQELTAVVTGYREGGAIVRIGDTELRLPDEGPDLIDTRVRIHVRDFDATEHVGTAEVLDIIGEERAL